MEHDEDAHKGTAVTKPIDLSAKKTGGSIRGKEKNQCADPADAAKSARSNATVGATGRKPKPQIVDQIGLRLRGVYNDVLMQPIPDRFIDLLQQLEGSPSAGMDEGARHTGTKKGAK
jgi:hypothetical protein